VRNPARLRALCLLFAVCFKGRVTCRKVDGNRKKGAKGYPLHALHFFFYFGPQGLTSTQCLRDESCLAVGGQSVWASFGDPRLDVAKVRSVRVCAIHWEQGHATVVASVHSR
jgi:hypothetical protein